MHAKVVLHRLEDPYVSQAHYPEHPESARIKDEEEGSPSIKDEEEFVYIKGFRGYLGAERQEPESPGVKEDVELPQIKEEEEPEPCQQKQLPIKKEEEEEKHITRSNGEPLKSEDGPSEAGRGAEPPSGCSSSSTEGLQADIFITPSNRSGTTSHSPYNDDGHQNSRSDDKLSRKCSQCGKTFPTKQTCHSYRPYSRDVTATPPRHDVRILAIEMH
ncbi:uncharacterized protein LOC130927768 [Corythoichthys intestinalis]|uniref:uncharacterized protein LOC130927768 n=1 Tax=Corythoichthys intestinalis TaxID=161448 RepID=UPI0025A67B83|nr:uncharacterized protein LOC130927768 [Corythoichthys intestinalis]